MSGLHTVTVIFYKEKNLEIRHDVKSFPEDQEGRVQIPSWYKKDKNIVAICDGNVSSIQQAN